VRVSLLAVINMALEFTVRINRSIDLASVVYKIIKTKKFFLSLNFAKPPSFVCGFTFRGLPATGPHHHHLQGEVWTNRHPASSAGMSRQCETFYGSRPQEHRFKSVRRHLFLQAPQWPCEVWIRFCRDYCCLGRSKPGCRIEG